MAETREPRTVASTKLRTQIGRTTTDALRGIPTIITQYDQPTAVIISYDEWQRLRALDEAARETK